MVIPGPEADPPPAAGDWPALALSTMYDKQKSIKYITGICDRDDRALNGTCLNLVCECCKMIYNSSAFTNVILQ